MINSCLLIVSKVPTEIVNLENIIDMIKTIYEKNDNLN